MLFLFFDFNTQKPLEGLILAQSERWRRGLGMQVERSIPAKISEGLPNEIFVRKDSGKRVSNAWVTYLKEEDSLEKSGVILHNFWI